MGRIALRPDRGVSRSLTSNTEFHQRQMIHGMAEKTFRDPMESRRRIRDVKTILACSGVIVPQ